MAIVRNLGNPAQPIDKSYCVPNRTDVTAPATPQYAGEVVNGVTGVGAGATPGAFVATGLGVKDWVPFSVSWGMNKSSG